MKNNRKNDKKDLGQFFTPQPVARMMVDFLMEGINLKDLSILDPCVGKNIFFQTIDKLYNTDDILLEGVEIDKTLPDASFFEKKQRKLNLMNFFDYCPGHKFDRIIMNPPYVRQEDLVISTINNKNHLDTSVGEVVHRFNGQINLYIYFFIKCLDLLKPGGKLVAICYDSWLYTRYGKIFKNFIAEKASIGRVVHFKESVFSDADIGATIIEIVNKKGIEEKFIEIDNLNGIGDIEFNGAIANDYKNKTRINRDVLENFCYYHPKLRRGIETPHNKFFYFPLEKQGDCFREIVKDPKGMKGFKVTVGGLKKLLFIRGKTYDKELNNYINSVEKTVLSSIFKNYRSLKKKMNEGDGWYMIREIQPGNIIFNYYFRKKIKFVYNEKRYLVANNFYTFDSEDVFLDLAILNSTCTQKSILGKARPQGRGLFKIQLYELKEVPIIRKEILEIRDAEVLRTLGKELTISTNLHEEIIRNIDKVINHYSVQ